MPSRVDELLGRIADLQEELEKEFVRARERWSYWIESGRVYCGYANGVFGK